MVQVFKGTKCLTYPPIQSTNQSWTHHMNQLIHLPQLLTIHLPHQPTSPLTQSTNQATTPSTNQSTYSINQTSHPPSEITKPPPTQSTYQSIHTINQPIHPPNQTTTPSTSQFTNSLSNHWVHPPNQPTKPQAHQVTNSPTPSTNQSIHRINQPIHAPSQPTNPRPCQLTSSPTPSQEHTKPSVSTACTMGLYRSMACTQSTTPTSEPSQQVTGSRREGYHRVVKVLSQQSSLYYQRTNKTTSQFTNRPTGQQSKWIHLIIRLRGPLKGANGPWCDCIMSCNLLTDRLSNQPTSQPTNQQTDQTRDLA